MSDDRSLSETARPAKVEQGWHGWCRRGEFFSMWGSLASCG